MATRAKTTPAPKTSTKVASEVRGGSAPAVAPRPTRALFAPAALATEAGRLAAARVLLEAAGDTAQSVSADAVEEAFALLDLPEPVDVGRLSMGPSACYHAALLVLERASTPTVIQRLRSYFDGKPKDRPRLRGAIVENLGLYAGVTAGDVTAIVAWFERLSGTHVSVYNLYYGMVPLLVGHRAVVTTGMLRVWKAKARGPFHAHAYEAALATSAPKPDRATLLAALRQSLGSAR